MDKGVQDPQGARAPSLLLCDLQQALALSVPQMVTDPQWKVVG